MKMKNLLSKKEMSTASSLLLACATKSKYYNVRSGSKDEMAAVQVYTGGRFYAFSCFFDGKLNMRKIRAAVKSCVEQLEKEFKK